MGSKANDEGGGGYTPKNEWLTAERFRYILKKYWGFDSFRGIQQDIIESIASGRDTLGLMPTGGGKSVTFQVPALCMQGVCIVVTPLIALMKDQVAHLRQQRIQAAAIYTGMSHDEVLKTLENAVFGGIKILYISPERLGSPLFQAKLRHMQVSFITVDEAHCISQWGYDFRPSYLHIADIRNIKPDAPILALTATATPAVVDDIQQQLHFRQKNVFSMSFERKNLTYIVRNVEDKQEQLLHILHAVEGCAIVYVHSRKRTKEIATLLYKEDISALAYHAGLDSTERDRRQEEWQRDEARVMVATNAFGMGIDKADVRLVVHFDCPDSPEAYFQEAGRAGRDGRQAYAVLLCNKMDISKLRQRIDNTYPPREEIKQVYEHLAYYYQIGVGSGRGASFEFNIDLFCQRFKHFPIRVEAALNILTRAKYISYEEERDNKARVHFTIGRDDLYRLHSLSANENNVITAMLRNYSGMFSDYSFIDEAYIAGQAGLQSQQQVYMILKNLSEKHILRFIPQRRTPYITYLQSREDPENVILPPEIYDERKKEFAARIEQMIRYFSTDDECRQRMLLSYFGEKKSQDCGQCDVCRKHRHHKEQKEEKKSAGQAILNLLSDNKRHHIDEFNSLPIRTDILDAALHHLMEEETVYMDDCFVRMKNEE